MKKQHKAQMENMLLFFLTHSVGKHGGGGYNCLEKRPVCMCGSDFSWDGTKWPKWLWGWQQWWQNSCNAVITLSYVNVVERGEIIFACDEKRLPSIQDVVLKSHGTWTLNPFSWNSSDWWSHLDERWNVSTKKILSPDAMTPLQDTWWKQIAKEK